MNSEHEPSGARARRHHRERCGAPHKQRVLYCGAMTPESAIALAPRFARVVLPIPVEQAFTYEIPEAMQALSRALEFGWPVLLDSEIPA